MAGEYGIAAGISAGLDKATSGMVKAEEIRQNRVKFQRESQLFEQQMQAGQQTYDMNQQKLEQLNMEIANMKKNEAKKDTFNAFDAFERTGDTKFLTQAIKTNDILKGMADKQGVVSYENPEDFSKEKLASFGLTEELLKDPSKRIVIINKADGTQVPADIMGMYAQSGYLSKLDKDKLNAISLRHKEAQVKSAETKVALDDIKFKDIQEYLQKNPTATYSDYIKAQKPDTSSSLQKEAEYIRKTYGEEKAKEYIDSKINDNTSISKPTAGMRNTEYAIKSTNAIKEEAGVKELWQVDATKLKGDNLTRFNQMAEQDAKTIKDTVREGIASISGAADKLNSKDLAKTTGIIDASVDKAIDTLGLNLDDEVLTQQANYNLIRNSIIRASYGTQVTGNELNNMVKQIGTEFKADKTVRLKMAETLENIATKFSVYKSSAPAYYAREFRGRVERINTMANALRDVQDTKKIKKITDYEQSKTGPKEGDTKEWKGNTYKVINGKWVAQ